MQTISLIGVASYLPEKIVENDFFGEEIQFNKNVMFEGALRRRHVDSKDTAEAMIEKAAAKLIEKLNLNPRHDIDAILTNVTLPDQVFMGCGAGISHKISACPRIVLDIHNAGCISFVYMMDIACGLIRSGKIKNALICNVQNAAGQVFAQSEIRKKVQSAIPGDGCGVGYLALSSENPILSIAHRCYGEYASDMFGSSDDGRKYWETGESQLYIQFTEEKIVSIIRRANSIVPDIIHEACKLANLTIEDIDALITNQPNPLLLKTWREAVGIPEEKHLDTFSEYGNLFGAAIPINLDESLNTEKVKANDKIMLAGFSHAGDFSAAALLHWKANAY